MNNKPFYMDTKPIATFGKRDLHAGDPPVVVMSHRAAERMKAFVTMSPIEVAGMGLLEVRPGKYGRPDQLYVEDVWMMMQDCSAAAANLDPRGIMELQDRLEKKFGKIMDRYLRTWWHSHGELEIGWSRIDTNSMRELTETCEQLCLLTNRAAVAKDADGQDRFLKRSQACYLTGPPARTAWNNLRIEQQLPNPQEGLLEEAIEEFHGAISNLPKEVNPSVKEGRLVVEYQDLGSTEGTEKSDLTPSQVLGEGEPA